MLKWFKKLLSSIDSFNRPQSHIDILIEVAAKLDYLKFKGIQSSDKSILRIYVPYFTIIEYLSEIRKCTNYFRNGNILHLESFPTLIKYVTISSFFLNEDNFYIDEIKAIEQFNKEVLELAKLYKNKLDSENNSGVDNHNMRHLTPLINNLYELYHVFDELI